MNLDFFLVFSRAELRDVMNEVAYASALRGERRRDRRLLDENMDYMHEVFRKNGRELDQGSQVHAALRHCGYSASS